MMVQSKMSGMYYQAFSKQREHYGSGCPTSSTDALSCTIIHDSNNIKYAQARYT